MVNQKQPPYSRDNRASANEHGLRLGSLDMPLGMGPTRDKDTSAVAGRAMRLMLLAGWLAGYYDWLSIALSSIYWAECGFYTAFTFICEDAITLFSFFSPTGFLTIAPSSPTQFNSLLLPASLACLFKSCSSGHLSGAWVSSPALLLVWGLTRYGTRLAHSAPR